MVLQTPAHRRALELQNVLLVLIDTVRLCQIFLHIASELAVCQRTPVPILTCLTFFHELVHDLLCLLSEHASLILHCRRESRDKALLFSGYAVVDIFPFRLLGHLQSHFLDSLVDALRRDGLVWL